MVGAVAIGIGGMVGGGIFAVLGVAAEQAGGATPLAFAIAGIVAGLTAYSYTKLSVAYPNGGGTVHFIDQVFGREAVTGTINVVLWAGYIATTALYASAFGNYGASLLPGDLESSGAAFRVLAVVGIAIPWLINLAAASLVSRTEGIVVGIKMTILLVVVAAGIPSTDAASIAPSTWSSPVGIVAAGMLVFVAYEGFELISNASADIDRPARNLPLAYGLSVGIVVVLYVLISAVVVGSLSASEIQAAADYALAEAASTSLGRAGFTLVGVSALLATFSAINATLYGAARLSFTIASEGELPKVFERRTWHQPIGLHVTAAVGLAIAVGLNVSSISGLSSLIFLAVFAFVNVAAVRADADAGVNRFVSGAGALAAAASFVVLAADNVRNDTVSVVVFVLLVGTAMVAEVALFHRTRVQRIGEGLDPSGKAAT